MPDDWTWGEPANVPTEIVVHYADGREHSYLDRGWRIERVGGESFLIIGRGIPCTLVPLSGVLSFDLVEQPDR